ncbi:hypothetical protein VTK56DRAFT_6697 [Thermocarpiscus australiensis]
MLPLAIPTDSDLRLSPASVADSWCSEDTFRHPPSRAIFLSGICTPPADENMGTTYEVPRLATCEKYHIHHPSCYALPMLPSDYRRPPSTERADPNEQVLNSTSRRPAPPANHVQAMAATRSRPSASPTALPAVSCATAAQGPLQREPVSRQAARSSMSTLNNTPANSAQAVGDGKMTLHSLNIPERISPKGGSLADLVAETAAFFWFGTTKMLVMVEKLQAVTPKTPIQPFSPGEAVSQHFRKWVLTILTTTQVTQNVVILALLYIYRLKMANPTVKGRPGSEYRLVTVALMLGNKFLDDNTYTNKTWADVSGISVDEIHVMEVEFLSNMRYSLLVSAEEWNLWLDKLARFWSYLELAKRPVSRSPSPLLIPSPTHRSYGSPLPSPIGPLHLVPGTQLAMHPLTSHSPSLGPLSDGNGTQNWPAPYGESSSISPLDPKPERQSSRKRGFSDEDLAEPPAKRMGRVPVGQGNLATQSPSQPVFQHQPSASRYQHGPQHPANIRPPQSRGVGSAQGRLPVPTLTLNTAQAAAVAPVTQPQPQPQPYGTATYMPAQTSPLALPPLVRAFPTMTYAPAQTIPATSGAVTPTTSYPPMRYGTPTKRLSPQSALGSTVPYAASSPLADSLGQHMAAPMGARGSGSGLHTPIAHSPSVYLQDRNSPYKPVRHVNTLLYPTSSAFLQQFRFPNPVLPNQMYYQPLGRRKEYRTGILPEFALASTGRPGPMVGGQPPVVPSAQYQPATQALPNPHQPRAAAAYAPRPAPRQAPSYPGQY